MRSRSLMVICLAALIGITGRATAQHVEVEEFTLDNGMKFLLVPRADQPNSISTGWVAKVGSVNERPGITGISHFFEHMMFKGTNTIGTRDAKLDADYMARQKALKDHINQLTWTEQYHRYFRGELQSDHNDPWDPVNDTEEIRSLRAQLKQLMDEHGQHIVKNEFDKIYTDRGGSGMNAFTTEDITFYFITVPSNKIELWAWMESDRLSDSVFREFYAERDVVHEERRMRTESTPIGIFQEQFESMFWQSSPYSWPVVGWPSDLNSYTREEAQRYWNIYYRPNNLVGVLVGDFDAAKVKPLIREYFGRLKKGEQTPPPVVTIEVPQRAEQRMEAECDCQPQVEVRYHTVPFNHADSFALELMADILNGRTGRLYKSMIEGKAIASDAQAFVDDRKYGGAFSFAAEVKGNSSPQELEQAWYTEVRRLQDEPVPARELQKVKNGVAADTYRRLQSNSFLMRQLGSFEAFGGWEYINESPAKLQAVTAEDIQRVAKKYFDKTNRSVAIYLRKAGSEPDDPEIAALEPRVQQFVRQAIKQIQGMTDLEELRQNLAASEAQVSRMPEGRRAPMELIQRHVRQRIAELEAASKSN